MKKKNFLWLIAFALLMPLFALTACSDDDDDDDNDSNGDKTEQTSNDGTKVQSKKVTKIVENSIEPCTWYFDENGTLTSTKVVYGPNDTSISTFTYSNDKIEVVEVEGKHTESWTYLLENGRVVEWRQDEDGHEYTRKYTYSPDGYLASSSYIYDDGDKREYKYTIENGNFTKIERLRTEVYDEYRSEKSTSISYSSKLNNLNVDLTALLLREEGMLGNYFGKRSKNLPSTITEINKVTRTYKGETTEDTYSKVKNFEYIYEGDYPVKILEDMVEDGEAETRTYEIFYE